MSDNKQTILLVEDDAGIRDAVGKFLEMAGYNVVACDDYYAAEDYLAVNKPDLVLTDFNYTGLPGPTENKGGLNTVTLVRQKFGPDFPCLLMSGSQALNPSDFTLFSNGDNYIVKPVTKAVVVNAVAKYLPPSVPKPPSGSPSGHSPRNG